MKLPQYDNGVLKRTIEIEPDFPVWVVVQGHDYEGVMSLERELGDLRMPEAYASEEQAKRHWRFTSAWIPRPEREAARVERTTYGDWVKQLGLTKDGRLNLANPFEGLDNAEFKLRYRQAYP